MSAKGTCAIEKQAPHWRIRIAGGEALSDHLYTYRNKAYILHRICDIARMRDLDAQNAYNEWMQFWDDVRDPIRTAMIEAALAQEQISPAQARDIVSNRSEATTPTSSTATTHCQTNARRTR